ncbi:hypothetical protein [Nonomuraea sp. NPDC050691]|uniref:hypothetical protein n=1 Tax=Nonomuraea sp. NPDC050691 TaxID=3155661 RepID=UPI0033D1C73F
MRPVAEIATGFVITFGSFKVNGFDLLVDPAGWGLCVAGLSQLRRAAGDPFDRAESAAVAMVCVSLAAVVTSLMGSVPEFVGDVVGLTCTAGALIAVWGIADAVIRRVRPAGETSRAALLDVLRWAVTGMGALGALAVHGYAGLGAVAGVACLTATVILIVVLYRSAGLPCLAATESGQPNAAEPA